MSGLGKLLAGKKIFHTQPMSEEHSNKLGRWLHDNNLLPSDICEYVPYKFIPDDTFLSRWALSHYMSKRLPSEGVKRDTTGHRIAIIAIYPWWISFFLGIASYLAERGNSVDIYWMGHSRPERYSENWETYVISGEMENLGKSKILGNISLIQLDPDINVGLNDFEKQVVEDQSQIDLRMYSRSETIDPCSNPEKGYLDFRRDRNAGAIAALKSLDVLGQYHHWISHSGSAVEYGVAHNYLSHNNESVINIEFAQKERGVILSANSPFSVYDTCRLWQENHPFELDDDEMAAIDLMLHEHKQPKTQKDGWVYPLQTAKKRPVKELIEELGIEQNKLVILLLPNIGWDSTVLIDSAHTIFEGMSQWVIETTKHLLSKDGVQLIIKAHPMEKIVNSRDTARSQIEGSSIGDLSDIVFVDANSEVNTFDLLPVVDLGLVYMSDIGFEMVLDDTPVIGAANSKYSGYGIIIEPETRNEYFEALDGFIEHQGAGFVVTEKQKKLARYFAHLLWNRIVKPFPWRPGGFWGYEQEFRMKELVDLVPGSRFQQAFNCLEDGCTDWKGIL